MGCYHEGADAPRQRFDRSLVLILFDCIASRWRLSLASGRVEEASWREDIVSCLCQSVHVATAGGDPRPGAPSFFGRDTPTRDCCYERCCCCCCDGGPLGYRISKFRLLTYMYPIYSKKMGIRRLFVQSARNGGKLFELCLAGRYK